MGLHIPGYEYTFFAEAEQVDQQHTHFLGT